MNIICSKEAAEKLAKIQHYINQNFGEAVSQKYLKQVFKSIERLASFPSIHPESQKRKGFRKLVVKKNTIILYKVAEEAIYIATVFDNLKGK